jgi:hypothetical protein
VKKLVYRCAMMLALVFAPQTMSVSHANVISAVDFSTFSDGDLVGQNGWVQFGTPADAPLQVQSGSVSWAGGSTANNQDAMLGFSSQITPPATGTSVYDFDLRVQILSAPATNPSYFAALQTLTDNSTSGNFQNARIAAQALGNGFVFGTRVNGQGGYPFAFGTQELNLNQTYAVRARINMVAENANDFIELYVGDDFDNMSLHATATYSGSGTVADPSFGGFILSQFGSTTVNEPGVRVFSMSFSSVPEPSSMALLAAVSFAGVAFRKRLKRA